MASSGSAATSTATNLSQGADRITYHGRKHEEKGLDEGDYIRLPEAARQQLGPPTVLVWDNLNAHRSARCAATSPPETGRPSSTCRRTRQKS
jgi:hypothetical protein